MRGTGQPNAKSAKMTQRTQRTQKEEFPDPLRVLCESFALFAFGF
jgi:hypothetical protein